MPHNRGLLRGHIVRNNLVVLINPGHIEEEDHKFDSTYGIKSKQIHRDPPPISIINLGGFIRDHGYEVVILDTHIEKNYKARLLELIKENPLAIGFSVFIGIFIKNVIQLTKMIKDINRDIPVVWGGKLTHLARNIILEQTDADFLVLGDGEFPLLNLLNCLRNGKDYNDIPGVGYKKAGKVIINHNAQPVDNLDSIYISDDFGWDLIQEHVNIQQLPYYINIYTSRGCKYNCSFCYLQDINEYSAKIRYRRRSADNIIREINYLHNKFGINVITFGDDDFLSNINEVFPVINYLRQNNIFIEQLSTNIKNLRPEVIDLLKGICQTVNFSIETVTPRLHKILRKSIPIDKVLEITSQLRKAGINTGHNIILAIPTETDQETKANIDFLKKLKEVNPHVRGISYIMSPIPGTPIFEFSRELTGADMRWDLEDLANFHFNYMGRAAFKFRPYLTPDDNLFYETVSDIFNGLFQEMNQVIPQQFLDTISENKRLSYIFGDLDKINAPSTTQRKYILDQVLEAMDAGLPHPRILPF